MKRGAITLIVLLSVASHTDAQYLYWSEDDRDGTDTRSIFRSRLDGSQIENVMVEDGAKFGGIAFDVANGKLFSGDIDHLFSTNLDGSGRQNLVSAEGNQVADVEIDLLNGKVYWSEFLGIQRIRRVNLDGSDPEVIVSDIGGLSEGLAVDPIGGKLYFSVATNDPDPDHIDVVDLDGANRTLFRDLSSIPSSIPFDVEINFAAGELYWNDILDEAIYAADLSVTDPFDFLPKLDVPDGTSNGMHFDTVNSAFYINANGATEIQWAFCDGMFEPVVSNRMHLNYMETLIPEPSSGVLLLGCLLCPFRLRRR